MPAYLTQIAASATTASAGRRTLSPLIRSQSPIAERDQRLMLTDAAWTLDETQPASEHPFAEISSPATRTRAEDAWRRQESAALPRAPKNRLSAAGPSDQAASKASDPARPEALVPSEKPLSAEAATAASLRPTVAQDQAASPGRLPRAAWEQTAATAPVSIIEQTDPARAEPNSAGTQARLWKVAGESRATTPSALQSSPPLLHEPEVRATALPYPGQKAILRSSEPAGKRPAEPREWPPMTSPSEPAPSGVVIGRIEVEVVPPPAERPAAKAAPRQPARSGPVSQIGPLGGVPRHLAFSVRHY